MITWWNQKKKVLKLLTLSNNRKVCCCFFFVIKFFVVDICEFFFFCKLIWNKYLDYSLVNCFVLYPLMWLTSKYFENFLVYKQNYAIHFFCYWMWQTIVRWLDRLFLDWRMPEPYIWGGSAVNGLTLFVLQTKLWSIEVQNGTDLL